MNLREGEQILKVYRHHPTPFLYLIFKVIIGTFPFFFMLFLFQSALSPKWSLILHVFVFALFSLIVIYVSLIYWLDRLIVTGERIICVDWKFITIRQESEAFLDDIQDIQTTEKGFLSAIKAFDYGLLKVETASSLASVLFPDAPDPEGIRQFIYHVKKQ
jgi:hypothetical protein